MPPAQSATLRSRRLKKASAALEHGARAFVALLRDVEKFDLQGLAPGPLG